MGDDVFRDNGSHLSLKEDITDHGVKAALMIAMVKFNGQPLVFNGSDELRAKCVEVAAKEGLRLSFADPEMERERQEKLRPDAIKAPKMTLRVRKKTEDHGRSIPRRELMEL